MLSRESSVPIYIQIQELLEEMLQRGQLKSNDLVPSENEMAEKLKVSRLTVRKSYVEMVKRGLFYTIQGKGTYVKGAKSLTSEVQMLESDELEKVKVIGVILPEVHGFYGDIFQGIQKACAMAHYSVQLMFNDEIPNEITAIKRMIASSVDGIIISPSRNVNTVIEHYQKLISSGIPTVMVGKPPFKVSACTVFCDDILGVYRAVELLIAHENTYICYITDSAYKDEASKERYAGYCAAMRDYLPNGKQMVLDIADEDFEVKLKQMVTDSTPVTAFFCYCDRTAANVYSILKKINKRIPEDIEIIGYDNAVEQDNFGIDKKLTSIDQRRILMGTEAVGLLERLMRGEGEKHTHMEVVIHPKLVNKETTRSDI